MVMAEYVNNIIIISETDLIHSKLINQEKKN